MITFEWLSALEFTEHYRAEVHGIWLHPDLMAVYPEGKYLIGRAAAEPLAAWFIPMESDGTTLHARRTARIAPYCAPWLGCRRGPDRRELVRNLLLTLMRTVHTIDLPLAPYFRDTAPFAELGAVLEYRHTQVIDLDHSNLWSIYTPKLRNHIRHACKVTEFEIVPGCAGFDFERGVVGQTVRQRTLRRTFACRLAEVTDVFCAEARTSSGVVGQAMIAVAGTTAYYFHAWFDRSAPRGVPSALLDSGISHARRVFGIRKFDLEGSVLPSVDRFLASFGGTAEPLAHVYWNCGIAAGGGSI